MEWSVRINEQDITDMILGIDFGQGESQTVEFQIRPALAKEEWKQSAEDVEYEAV